MEIYTRLVQFSPAPGDKCRPSSTPIYQTATFEQDSATEFGDYDYSRSGNPTRDVLNSQLAILDHAYGSFAVNSGMAAIVALASLLEAGDEVVLGDDLYGGTYRYFERIARKSGLTVRHVDTTGLAAAREAMTDKTRLVLVESPTNPTMRINDIRGLAEIAHEFGALLAVDNTLMSPYLCAPLILGADVVIHSATKALSGHADLTAGVISAIDPEVSSQIAFAVNAQGLALAPFDSWLLLRGMKTLAIRLDRQVATAARLAAALSEHSGVSAVYHPSLPGFANQDLHRSQCTGDGNVISFQTGSAEASARLIEACKLFRTTVSFGSVTSSISLPFCMSHASIPLGVREHRAFTPDLIRVSVGIEAFGDLWADLEQALEAAKGARLPDLALATG